jgi:DNA-binding response OmpR family regulator
MAAVLIVDDDDTVRDVLYELFAEEHVCDAVESAERALPLLESGRYDVAVVDVSLPGMSGLELSGIILQRWPGTHVIIITGIDYREYSGELTKMGVFDYLVKPFHLHEAQGKLARAILKQEHWPEAVRESAERALGTYGREPAAGSGRGHERRRAARHKTQRAARLMFTAESAAVGSRPAALIGHTHDISTTGLALVVPCVREGDREFYGKTAGLRLTLSLPTVDVEIEATPARYEWLDPEGPGRRFLVGARITGMGAGARAIFEQYLGALG